MNVMNKVYVKLNRNGVRALLKSQAMQDILTNYSNNAVARAGEGYGQNVRLGVRRCYANIYAETYEAAVDNENNNTLLVALHG